MPDRPLNGFVLMPEEVAYRNGGTNTRCSMLVGPCGCGAWHSLSEWSRRTIGGVPVSEIGAVRRVIEGEIAGR